MTNFSFASWSTTDNQQHILPFNYLGLHPPLPPPRCLWGPEWRQAPQQTKRPTGLPSSFPGLCLSACPGGSGACRRPTGRTCWRSCCFSGTGRPAGLPLGLCPSCLPCPQAWTIWKTQHASRTLSVSCSMLTVTQSLQIIILLLCGVFIVLAHPFYFLYDVFIVLGHLFYFQRVVFMTFHSFDYLFLIVVAFY